MWLEGRHYSSFPIHLKAKLGLHGGKREGKEEEGDVDAKSVVKEVEDEKVRVAHSGDEDLLRVLHLSRTFGKNKAVDDVSFGIRRGETLALLGPNGAGKSTIINLIRGEIEADAGTILVKGVDMGVQSREGRRFLGCEYLVSIFSSFPLRIGDKS